MNTDKTFELLKIEFNKIRIRSEQIKSAESIIDTNFEREYIDRAYHSILNEAENFAHKLKLLIEKDFQGING